MTEAPMLQHLGGDHPPTTCLDCGNLCLRDLFGHPVCLHCTTILKKLKVLQESGVCPRCGSRELSAWSGFSEADRLCLIWCVDCENGACVSPSTQHEAVDRRGYHKHRDYILWTWLPISADLDDLEDALLDGQLSEVRHWRNTIGGRAT